MKALHLVAAVIAISVSTLALAKGGGGHSSSSSYSGSSSSSSSHSVRGYVRKDGTYVEPHRATNPNDTKSDNWSTKGNVNPYTGKEGTKDPDAP